MADTWTNTTDMDSDLLSFLGNQHDANDSNEVVGAVLPKLVSDSDRFIVTYILSCFLGIPMCVIGIIGNIINIIVFMRQGFTDSINISLLCLSISDLGALVTVLWRNILYIPAIDESGIPWHTVSFLYLTGGTPHNALYRISGCITVFIAIERCICIAFPLKVKQIFTHFRTTVINIVIFVVVIAAVVPIFATHRISWNYYASRNRTLLGISYAENYQNVIKATFYLNGIVFPFTSFFLDVVCTIIMVVKLQSQAKWRQVTSASGKDTGDSGKKDLRVMKMVLILTVIFIICSVPLNFNFIWRLTDSEISVTGKYSNTLRVAATVAYLCEAINSSLNHFVYINMSSKFRATYKELFVWIPVISTSK